MNSLVCRADDLPGRRLGHDLGGRTRYVRQQGARGAVAVVAGGRYVSAERVEKAVYLALAVVEASCARPSVGAAVDGFGSLGVVDTAEFARQHVERFVPGHFYEWFIAATIAPGCRW